MNLEEYEKLDPVTTVDWFGRSIRFSTPNQYTFRRMQTLFTKEPDTIEWIASFSSQDIFFDVGANVGMYTIWAAATKGVQTFSFEPESQNFALINKNILLNSLNDKVKAFCLALGDETRLGELFLSSFKEGAGCHTFGERINYKLEPFTPRFSQGCLSTTIDDLVTTGGMPIPQHIKIDVDGLEHKVLAGAKRTLENPALNSVLVELNTNLDLHCRVVRQMEELGFTYSKTQVEAALRKEGPFKGVGNHIFRR